MWTACGLVQFRVLPTRDSPSTPLCYLDCMATGVYNIRHHFLNIGLILFCTLLFLVENLNRLWISNKKNKFSFLYCCCFYINNSIYSTLLSFSGKILYHRDLKCLILKKTYRKELSRFTSFPEARLMLRAISTRLSCLWIGHIREISTRIRKDSWRRFLNPPSSHILSLITHSRAKHRPPRQLPKPFVRADSERQKFFFSFFLCFTHNHLHGRSSVWIRQ